MQNQDQGRKISVEEKFQIYDSPWADSKTQGVNFHDYKASIKTQQDKEREGDKLEKNRLGDIALDKKDREVIDSMTEDERDRKIYADYLKKGLVNIKNLVLKNPLHRTAKENEFLILHLKHEYEVF